MQRTTILRISLRAAVTFLFLGTFIVPSLTNAQDNFNCNSELYQVVNGRDLKKLNPTTGSYEHVGTSSITYNGAGFNVEDGYIYGMSGSTMVRINNSGQATSLGNVSGFNALSYSGDFDTDGNWYSFKDNNGTFTMNTVDVSNTSNLTATVDTIFEMPGSGSLGNCADVAYNTLTGKFYGMRGGVIHEFDNINFTVTPIADYSNEVSGGAAFGAVWTDNEGNVYFFNNTTGNIYKASFDASGNVTGFTFAATSEPNGSNDGMACSQAEPPVFPEICDNGIDDDGDGLIDCEDDDCTLSDACKIDGSILSTSTSLENGFVTYQVFLTNNTNINKSFTAYDTLPGGFEFVQDTLDFDQNGLSDFALNPIEGDQNNLSWGTLSLEPGETLRIAYDLIINSSVQPDTYQNLFTLSNNELKEGTLQAAVEVVDDYTPEGYSCDPAFYQVYKKRGKNQPNLYGRLDPLTGDYDQIAVASDKANALGFDINTGLVYGASGRKFIQLDSMGVVTYQGITFNKNVYRGDVDQNSLWYGVDGSDMVVIDVSGTPTQIARYVGEGLSGWDIAYNKDGNFYSVHNNTLYKFDTTTNKKSTVGALIGDGIPSTGNGAQWTGSDGYLYISNNSTGKITRVDVNTRVARIVSQSIDGLQLNDGFSCPTSIPAVYGYDYGDNSGIPKAGFLSYKQDIGDDTIPENQMVWLGSTITVDDNDLSNSTADGDIDDGIVIASQVDNNQLAVTINLNSNFSTTANYLLGVDWDSDGTFDQIISGSSAINGAASVVEQLSVPVDYVTTQVNFRVVVTEEALSSEDISGINEKLGEVEDYRQAIGTAEICDNGIDDDLDGLFDCDDDDCANFGDCETTATSGGNNGGLESNNRLSEKIAKRNYERYKNNKLNLKVNTQERSFEDYRFQKRPVKSAKNVDSFELIDLIPTSGIPNTSVYNSTPDDLIGITNATQTLSVDYFDNEIRKGAILSTVSENGVYEHTKAVCDRVTGTSIINIWKVPMLDDQELMVSKLENKEGLIEYSCTFSFFIDETDKINIENHWNIADYTYNDQYYNLQVWADNMFNLKLLVNEVIQNIKGLTSDELNYTIGDIPEVFVRNFDYRNNKLYINVVNPGGLNQISVKGILASTETDSDRAFYDTFDLSGDIEDQIVFDTEGVYTIGFTINDDAPVTDNIFFADGVWGYDVDETKENVSTFATFQDFQSENDDDLYIERGAKIRGTINEKFVLYRSVEAKFGVKDISEYEGVAFDAKASQVREMDVILINPELSFEEQLKANIVLGEEQDAYFIDFASFVGDQENLKNISMIIFEALNWTYEETHFALELSKLRLTSNGNDAKTGKNSGKERLNKVYPNPVSSVSTLAFESKKSDHFELYVYNLNGNVVYVKQGKITPGLNRVEIERGNQASGNYSYQLILNNEDNLSGKLIFE
ncbi:DUF6923 family protein [Croceivirga thetidis]|uniref:T9SS type A sorting domain-containing protein n=1 Tax=Croceivirga thetidis TaxID=2721623 RepID=A0ABX1GL17_9FLAO|nr:GEVED domain-containing protein [Croceivirga thetidis]NKI30333.1 T9SS type A sorting domain-containing protein [Croceivirga thetidis]